MKLVYCLPIVILLLSRSPQKAAAQLAKMERLLQAYTLPTPLWAIADETDAGQLKQITKLAAVLRNAIPDAKLAGQLNHPRQKMLLKYLDVALVNPGFGVDRADLEALRRDGITPWFYNMPRPRLAAGFYLWRSGAQGYLQWHGRMPTADPFDPTDGREGDIQFLFPTVTSCPTTPDLQARRFEISQGVIDLRWLLWLEKMADKQPSARKLFKRLRREIPGTWEEVMYLEQNQAVQWRSEIIRLAQRLR